MTKKLQKEKLGKSMLEREKKKKKKKSKETPPPGGSSPQRIVKNNSFRAPKREPQSSATRLEIR